jgi:ketosteroid isomerase-like protein
MSTARELASRYFAAWAAKDFDALRDVLADDVTFRGPLGEADGADACIRGLRGLAENVGLPEVRVIATDGDDAVTWFDLETAKGPIPVANWSHVEQDRIVRVRVAFDPRPLLE